MDISYGYKLMSLCPEDTDIEWLTLLSAVMKNRTTLRASVRKKHHQKILKVISKKT
jgi:hypothetical protein